MQEAEFPGAACWAKLFNQNFIRMNMTSTIAWWEGGGIRTGSEPHPSQHGGGIPSVT
jgi:hypothetical protein